MQSPVALCDILLAVQLPLHYFYPFRKRKQFEAFPGKIHFQLGMDILSKKCKILYFDMEEVNFNATVDSWLKSSIQSTARISPILNQNMTTSFSCHYC